MGGLFIGLYVDLDAGVSGRSTGAGAGVSCLKFVGATLARTRGWLNAAVQSIGADTRVALKHWRRGPSVGAGLTS